VRVRVRILAKRTRTRACDVQSEFWQNAHVRAMCVRPKIEFANVRACEAKNRRNSQFVNFNLNKWLLFFYLFYLLFIHILTWPFIFTGFLTNQFDKRNTVENKQTRLVIC
jgi:hypothetical protein